MRPAPTADKERAQRGKARRNRGRQGGALVVVLGLEVPVPVLTGLEALDVAMPGGLVVSAGVLAG